MGKWFLAGNSATIGQILMIFSADPHGISTPIECRKISPRARLRARTRKLHQKFVFAIFVKRPIKPLGKIFRTQKNRLPKSFFLLELQEFEVRICVQPNSPITILILLQCLQSSRSQVGGSNPDSSVEEKFQKTLNPWAGRSQLLPETFKFELRPVWWGAGTERHSPPPSPSWLERY